MEDEAVGKIRQSFSNIYLALVKKKPLFGFILKGMRVVYTGKEREDLGNGIVSHISTDGDTILVYKDFLKFSERDQLYDVVHEIMHVVLKHTVRGRTIIGTVAAKLGVDFKSVAIVCNIAMDAKIYYYMKADRFDRSGGIPYDLYNFFKDDDIEKKSVEELVIEYFKEMEKKMQEYKSIINPDIASPSIREEEKDRMEEEENDGEKEEGREFTYLDVGNEESKEDYTVIQEPDELYNKYPIEEKIDRLIADGIVKSRMAGVGRGFIENVIEGIYLSGKKQPWYKILKEELGSHLVKYKINDWGRVSRKAPYVFAGKREVTQPKVFAAIDVSGSISNEDYRLFCKEIIDIAKLANVEIVFWDDGIVEKKRFRRKEDLEKRRGYGGTRFSPVLSELSKQIKREDILVVLTDCYWWDETSSCTLLDKIKCRKILVDVSDKVVWDKWDKVIRVSD